MSQTKKGVQLYYTPRILPDDIEDNQDEKNEDIDENQKTDRKIKRFIHSIIREEKDKFHELLKTININGKNHSTNWTPLMWAIQKDRIYFIEQMFNTDQIIDFSRHMDHKTKRTTLHFSAEKSNLKLLMLLLQKDKLQQNISDIDHKKIKLKVNAKDREQCTALYRASKAGAALVIKALLQHDANPNIANRDGITPLMISSIKGHKAAVDMLLNNDSIDVNMEDERGRTALMCACADDRIDIVKLLLKFKNLEFNAIDHQNFNWNCLMWCIYRKNEKMLHLLLDYDKNCDKFDYWYENYYNQTVLDMCVKKKLSQKITQKIRAKFHAIVFPKLIQAEIVLNLNVPLVVVSQLLVFVY